MGSVPRHMLVTLAALACAAHGVSAQQHAANAKKNPNEIVFEEVQATRSANVYELVQALRPQWLRIPGYQTLRTQIVETVSPKGEVGTALIRDEPDILVYLNNSKFGTVESLRDIDVENVHSLEFVSPAKATMRWGSGHTKGVIVVRSTRGEMPP